jgi:hypothetical protein
MTRVNIATKHQVTHQYQNRKLQFLQQLPCELEIKKLGYSLIHCSSMYTAYTPSREVKFATAERQTLI